MERDILPTCLDEFDKSATFFCIQAPSDYTEIPSYTFAIIPVVFASKFAVVGPSQYVVALL
jgi:hypothetical protein